MITTRFCPQCQQPLSADAPDGLCPQCLMKAAAGPAPSAAGVGLAGDLTDIANPGEVAKKLPQFEILELLGRGGMGVVYKARQLNLDRIVALKILPPLDAQSPDFVARFTREARALAKLNHPNIVNVYDFGETGGLYWIIMEFVDGANLRQLFQTRKLTAAEALAIVPKICDALQYAHEEGLVHRDIKPENLLLDKKGRVKIADFGLAKLLRREALDMTLTLSGMSLGTLRYMAPEQMDKPETVDHRADLYSLGVVIYEMLTGETPVGRFELPSQKAQVDVRFDEIVLHALEREPARRYQHASQVRDDVEKVTSTAAAPSPQSPTDAEDAEEDAEAEHSVFAAWGGRIIALVAVLLAFFNPWGTKGWFFFGAGCAIFGVLSAFGIGRRKAFRANSENEKPAAPAATKPSPRHLLSAFLVLLCLFGFFFGLSFQAKTAGTAAGVTTIITVGTLDPIFVKESGPSGFQTSLNFVSWSFFAVVVGGIAFGALWRIGREDQGKVPRDAAWWRDWWKQVGVWGGLLLAVCIVRTVMDPAKVLHPPGERTVQSRFNNASMAVTYLDGHTSHVKAVAVSPDGRTLVSAGMDGRVLVRDLPDGKLRRTAIASSHPKSAPPARLRCAVISPDSQRVVVGGDLRELESIQLFQNQIDILHVPNEAGGTIGSLMNAGGNQLAYITAHDSEIVFYDTVEQRVVTRVPIHPGQSNYLGRAGASPDGQFIAITTAQLLPKQNDRSISETVAPFELTVFDTTGAGRFSWQFADSADFVYSQVVFTDARTLAVCLPSGKMQRWTLDDAGKWQSAAESVRIVPGRYTAIAASRDGKIIWLAEGNQITGIDSTSGKGVAFVELKIGERRENYTGSAIDQIAVTNDPLRIVAALWDGRVALAKCWPLADEATKPGGSAVVPAQPFMIGLTGPELTNEAMQKLKLSKLQTDEINRIVLAYHRDYLALQRRHSKVGKDDAGRILVTIEPFYDECLALANRLQTELGGIVDPALLPVMKDGELAFQIFNWGGAYNETITMWKADGKYYVEEKLTSSPGHERDPFTFNMSGPKLEEIPEAFRIFWREN